MSGRQIAGRTEHDTKERPCRRAVWRSRRTEISSRTRKKGNNKTLKKDKRVGWRASVDALFSGATNEPTRQPGSLSSSPFPNGRWQSQRARRRPALISLRSAFSTGRGQRAKKKIGDEEICRGRMKREITPMLVRAGAQIRTDDFYWVVTVSCDTRKLSDGPSQVRSLS